MRLAISLNVSQLPIDYRMLLVSLIKQALANANPAYYERLYGADAPTKRMKPFCMGLYLQDFRLDEDVIRLRHASLLVSSPDPEFMLHVYNGLLTIEKFTHRGYSLQRGGIRLLPEAAISQSSVEVRTLSPLLIEDEQGKPVGPSAPGFAEHVAYYADRILHNYRGHGLLAPLVVTPGPMRKQVIRESNQRFRETQPGRRWLYFTAYKGRLQLQGHPVDLQLLYQLGLSKRRSQGFGLLDVVGGGRA